MGYLKSSVFSVGWVGALRASNRIIVYIKLAVLARLLTPEQFGVFGIAALVLAFLEILTETGVNVFLIQEKVELKDYINTAWIVSITRGIIISLVLFLIAFPISSFFKSPSSYPILLLIAFVPFVRGFINPSEVIFQKELKFSREFVFRFILYSIDAAVAVFFAVKTHSAVSLVWGMLAGALLEVLMSFVFLKPKPSMSVEIEKVKSIVSRGKWITFAGLFNYFFENVDDGVVGKLMSTASLGFYQMAYKIASLPLTEVSAVIVRVAFPVYVNIANDTKRLTRAYFKSLAAIATLVLPIGILLLVFPGIIVRLILGDAWLAIVPVVRVMSFFGVVRAVSVSAHPLFLAVKKQEYITSVTLVGLVVLAATIIPFAKMWGITGAGISALAGALSTLPLVSYYVIKILRDK